MSRKHFYLIPICFILSITLVAYLYKHSEDINTVDNGFVRFFPPHFVTNFKYIDIHYDSYYIAGISSQHVYLGDYIQTSNLLTADFSLKDTQQFKLSVPSNYKIAWRSVLLSVDSPSIYMMEGITPTILRGDLQSLLMKKQVKIDSVRFTSPLFIPPASFVVTTYDTIKRQNILSKVSPNSPHLIHSAKSLEKQLDGKFCTDGILSFSLEKNVLLYVYRYRNEFFLLDTNLNIIKKGKTIDTVSRVKIKLDSIKSQKVVTFSAPPLEVNKMSCVYGDKIYVNSKLRANNEDKHFFIGNAVIDIYNLKDGKYLYSFYLPNYKNKKLRGFKVYGNTIFALYSNYLATYHLNY